MTHYPDSVERVRAAIDAGLLISGGWGDGTEAVCLMSALVPGASSVDDCVTAGWPEWLARLNVGLFDADVGADDEDAARMRFALDMAEAVAVPVDMDRAHDLFLLARLDTGEHSALKSLRSLDGEWPAQTAAVEPVAGLLRRRLDGEDVEDEMTKAHAAADDAARAARAAAGAAAGAACAAAGAARAAADAGAASAAGAACAAARAAGAAGAAARAAAGAACAAAGAAADDAARAAAGTAGAARAAGAAAKAAAGAAAREDLIAALKAAHK